MCHANQECGWVFSRSWRRLSLPLLLLIGAASSLGAVTPQEAVRDARARASACFGRGAFAAAIPDFEQAAQLAAANNLDQASEAAVRADDEQALCYLFTGNFGAAEEAFQSFVARHPQSARAAEAAVYLADCQRLGGRTREAIRSYTQALQRFAFGPDLLTDIEASLAQCWLAEDDWGAAREPLLQALRHAPDRVRRGHAATLLATAYLKTLSLDRLYPLIPDLLQRDALAPRSLAFNMAALEAGDSLFQDERYREALWLHRLVFTYEAMRAQAEAYRDELQKRIEQEQKAVREPRRLLRLLEWAGETEVQLKALDANDNDTVALDVRVARGYLAVRRDREARELFLHLSATGDRAEAEEALEQAFACAVRLPPWTRAYAIGRQYMDRYPAGSWYDEVTLMLGQMHAREHHWAEVDQLFGEALKTHPQRADAAECLFLRGYAQVMEKQFDAAVTSLRSLRTRFAGSALAPGAIYWCAMAQMFNGHGEAAAQDFDKLLAQGPSASAYLADAALRRQACEALRARSGTTNAWGLVAGPAATNTVRVMNSAMPEAARTSAPAGLASNDADAGRAWLLRGAEAFRAGHAREALDAAVISVGLADKDLASFPDALLLSARGYEAVAEVDRARDVYGEVATLFLRTGWAATASERLRLIALPGRTQDEERASGVTNVLYAAGGAATNRLVASRPGTLVAPPAATGEDVPPPFPEKTEALLFAPIEPEPAGAVASSVVDDAAWIPFGSNCPPLQTRPLIARVPAHLALPEIRADARQVAATLLPAFQAVAGDDAGGGVATNTASSNPVARVASTVTFFGIPAKGERLAILLDASRRLALPEMGGASGCQRVKERVGQMLDDLQDGTRFNVIVFDDACATMAPAMVPARHETRRQARQFLRAFNTDGHWGLTTGTYSGGDGLAAGGGATRLDLAIAAAMKDGADAILIISAGLPRVQKAGAPPASQAAPLDTRLWKLPDFIQHIGLLSAAGRSPPVIDCIGYQVDRESSAFLQQLAAAYKGHYRLMRATP